jgi:hypothetical protein
MIRWLTAAAALFCLLAASPEPAPTPSPDAKAEAIFVKARQAWLDRSDVPYLRYGALVRYLHDGRVFDNWWDVYFRRSDGALHIERLVDPAEEKRRLGGIPFSIFGFKIFDTNPDAEPIRLEDPRIEPISSFGVLARFLATTEPSPPPAEPQPLESPLREITRVTAEAREYRIELAGIEKVEGADAYHLTLAPLREPQINRLRDLWVDTENYATLRANVQGILNGKPYDLVKWTVRYVPLDGRYYVQQIIADAPLRFGLDTEVPQMEIDYVDYRFPSQVPQFTFDRPF